jgi:hypothetical protein
VSIATANTAVPGTTTITIIISSNRRHRPMSISSTSVSNLANVIMSTGNSDLIAALTSTYNLNPASLNFPGLAPHQLLLIVKTVVNYSPSYLSAVNSKSAPNAAALTALLNTLLTNLAAKFAWTPPTDGAGNTSYATGPLVSWLAANVV